MTFLKSFVLSFISALWSGFAVSQLWNWFAVPLGLGVLPWFNAAGLCMLVTILVYQCPFKNEEEAREYLAASLMYQALLPFEALAVGWILHSFL